MPPITIKYNKKYFYMLQAYLLAAVVVFISAFQLRPIDIKM